MSADLYAINQKLLRAHEHLKLFEEESIAYFKECGPILDLTVDLKARTMRVGFTIEKAPPPRLGVLLGDCVHNARSALDNVICALVRVTQPASTCTGRQYPTFTNPDDYKRSRNKVLHGVPEPARALIDNLHPCSRMDAGILPSLHAVAILTTLSNRDKHRAPHLTAAYSRDTRLVITSAPPGQARVLRLKGPLYSDADVEIPFVSALVHHYERLQCHGAMHIAFKDRSMFGDESVLDLMDFCLDFVENTVISTLKPFL